MPDLGIDVSEMWQNAVNMLASLSPLLAVFVGMGLFFTFAFWLRGFLQRTREDKQTF